MSHRRKQKDADKAAQARRESLRRRRELRVWSWIVVVGVVVTALVAFVVLPAANRAPTTEGPNPGQLAPGFTIADVDGNAFSIRAQVGRVVVLDFMGSHCPSCEVEMPHLVNTYAAFEDRNFVMISIDVGGPLGTEDPEDARSFLTSRGGTWPIALDNQGLDSVYQVSALPTIVIVDTGGVVRTHHAGVLTDSQLSTVIEPLL